jgi:hypothetical protein
MKEDVLSPLIFNIDLEYVINVVAENQEKFKPNLLG